MKNIFLSTILIFSCVTLFAQKKDTSLTWLDDIDVALLDSKGAITSAPKSTSSQKYKFSESQDKSDIENADRGIKDADSRMMQYGNKAGGEDKYNQAAKDRYNAESAKANAEYNQQFHQNIADGFNTSMQQIKAMQEAENKARAEAINKKIETARNNYMLGQWTDCISNYQSAFKFVRGAYVNASITPSDWCLLARAGKRAIEKKQTLNMKQSPYEWNFTAYTNALASIKETTLSPFQKSNLLDEIISWYPVMLNNLPESSRSNYSKWFFDTFYIYLGNEAIRLSRLPVLIEGISKCEIASGDLKVYTDFIYALEHEGELQYLGHVSEIKADLHLPKIVNSIQVYSLSKDELFLNAAYYQEVSGNKAQALEVWLNYLDYANFNLLHKAMALYYGLALEKVEKLKKEVGTNVIPHINHIWGVKKTELDAKTVEKKKDEQRTKSGLDWDSDK